MKIPKKKQILIILSLSVVLAFAAFLKESVIGDTQSTVTRNSYGGGKRTEEYELTVENEVDSEPIQIEVKEREYTHEEVQEMFKKISEKLDEVIPGENQSMSRVEKDLNLVTSLEGYPARIQWQIGSYDILDIEGRIMEENLTEEGALVELRGTISYGEEKSVYIRNVMVYPPTRKGTDKLIYEIRKKLQELEEETRQESSFVLPKEIEGKKLKWSRQKENSWYYILLMGIVLSVFVVYREWGKAKREATKRKEELMRDYPGMISKFTMLLSTGATLKNAWEKIVQNYEQQKEQLGTHALYEEMAVTLREIQGGVSEAEAYERFGRRCKATAYLKFGAMLSQNLRKGSRGISELLRMEAIQSFENRKSTAKRLGEEAGTKLLMPMLGMLAVVMVMVIVPAFLTMQL